MKVLVARLLVVLLFMAGSACTTEAKKEIDPRDKFVGEWKSADTNAETHTYIKRTGDTFYIHEGQQDLVAAYDEATKSLVIDNGVKKVPVHYLPATDQIMVTGGSRDAKFSRVK
ncbi:hypothetical protein [Hymenobacter terricola]|uniref:hypothetical protein n=1 Tax=Hymenobacter terricola TaxID=2819236 RepID=UPI001B317532|nr:hypothetical protein [Hymenobacter terricola]